MRNFVLASIVSFIFILNLTYQTFAATDTKPTPDLDSHNTVIPTQESNTSGPIPFQLNEVFIGAGLNYFDSFGFQTRYAARIFPDGFIENFNDSFFVEGGAGLTFYGTIKGRENVIGINFNALARWDYYHTQDWGFFVGLGGGFNIVSGVDNDDVGGGGFYPCAGVGALYNITPEFAARFDLSYQYTGLGISFRF